MTDDFQHPADVPEQEITSEAPEFAIEQAEPTVEEDKAHTATAHEPATGIEVESTDSEAEGGEESEHEAVAAVQPLKLERLQKILAQAGIASRRHAEELITQGRVQVNGQTVTVLGSKADPARDHIRVDGKLLHGAERLRYFVLNKPKGYVTTVTDPEGRSTVMEFFSKLSERVYPVGRLDYQSEGLLLFTNDGDLANRLTKAASGVEKTYLVKVAGQPTEDQLDRLREGVAIERTKPGEGKVNTAPARIRQVRQGDNPWYEVVLIEGRNRELRKMFEEIGHHVEKIRRVGYGPLVLDLEPGNMRELDTEEVHKLRLTAEGKMKPRRMKINLALPKETSRPARPRTAKPVSDGKSFPRKNDGREKTAWQPNKRDARPRRENDTRDSGRDFGKTRSTSSNARPEFKRRERNQSEPRPSRFEPKPGTSRPFRPRDDARQASPHSDRGPRFDRGAPPKRPSRGENTFRPQSGLHISPEPDNQRPTSDERLPRFEKAPGSFRGGTGKPGGTGGSGFGGGRSKPGIGARRASGANPGFGAKAKPRFDSKTKPGGTGGSGFGSGRSKPGIGARRTSGANPGFGAKAKPRFDSRTKPAFGSNAKPFASKPRSGSERPAPPREASGGNPRARRFDDRPRGKRTGPPDKRKKRD